MKQLFLLFIMAMKSVALLILTFVLVQKSDATPPQKVVFGLFKKYEVFIMNLLPKNNSTIITHCFSGDDDIGNHTIYKPTSIMEFQFEFL